jgi:hypothetical protein
MWWVRERKPLQAVVTIAVGRGQGRVRNEMATGSSPSQARRSVVINLRGNQEGGNYSEVRLSIPLIQNDFGFFFL